MGINPDRPLYGFAEGHRAGRICAGRHIQSVAMPLFALLFFVLLSGVLLLSPAMLTDTFTYYRWDNVEYFIPMIKWAHGLILDGHLPVMNLRQHLGEPFATNVQTGVFYPVYTISVAISQMLALSNQHTALVIIWLNLSLSLCGFFCLSRQYGLNTPLSLALSVLTQTNGYVLGYSGVWLFVSSIAAWLPWCMVGLTALWRGKQWGGLLFAVSYGLIGHVGHPQFWAYTSLFLGLLIMVHGRKNFFRVYCVLPYFFCGILIAAPTLLPVIAFRDETSRVGKVALEAFLDVSATKSAFLGIVSPLLNVGSGFLTEQKIAVFTYQGPLSAICIAFGLYQLKQKRAHPLFSSVLIISLIFIVFAVGGNLPVYQWTYGLPVWSSFRWPSKFVLFVQFGLALLALLGLLRIVRQTSRRDQALLYIVICGVFIFWAAVLLIPQCRTPLIHLVSSKIIILAAAAFFLCLLWVHRPLVPWGIVVLSILSSIGTNALIHDINLKNYAEAYEVDYGFENRYRVAPSGKDEKQPYRLSRFNLASSATVLKYYSLTGVTHDIVSTRYRDAIPSGIFGGLPGRWLSERLATRFFEFLGVRFFVVGDDYMRNLFAKTPRYNRVRSIDGVDLYENPDAMPFAFFAAETAGSIDWSADPTVVHAEGLAVRDWSGGKIMQTVLTPEGNIKVRVSCSGQSLLVVSFLYLPGWTVTVNGAEQAVPVVVNDLVMGVTLPGGMQSVEFGYDPPFVKQGFLMCGIGLSAMIWIAYRQRNRKPRYNERRFSSHDEQ